MTTPQSSILISFVSLKDVQPPWFIIVKQFINAFPCPYEKLSQYQFTIDFCELR